MSTTPAAQVDVLARSAHLRYREALGEEIGEIPEGLYPGDYLKPVGAALAAEYRRSLSPPRPRSEWLALFRERDGRGDDRADQGRPRPARHPPRPVRVRGRGAGERQAATGAERWLRDTGLVYEGVLERAEGRDRTRIGSRSSCRCSARPQFGDDQDRPIKKSDGSWTYFGADLAYHHAEGARAPTS